MASITTTMSSSSSSSCCAAGRRLASSSSSSNTFSPSVVVAVHRRRQQQQQVVHARHHRRHASSAASSSSAPGEEAAAGAATAATGPPAPPLLRTALIIHRSPLLTAQPSPLTSTSHAHARALRAALSNPPSQSSEFYFKKGSLAERRFAVAEHARDVETFGAKLAGKKPDVGELPAEERYDVVPRRGFEEEGGEEWDADTSRLDRHGAEDVYLLTRRKRVAAAGKDESAKLGNGQGWSLPEGVLQQGEGLHESAMRAARDSLGSDLDLWLVTRKPIGLIDASSTASTTGSTPSPPPPTFIFKSHVLAGTPMADDLECAWLTKREIEERLTRDGASGERGRKVWEGVRDLLN